MAKSRRKRHTYSNAKRVSILQAAQNQGLTALDVQKRFGVTPVTYYSWRRKYVAGSRRATSGRGVRSSRTSGGFETQVRSEVQARVRQILPQIVRTEVSDFLESLFGSRRGRGRKV
jgi:transposase-like protein